MNVTQKEIVSAIKELLAAMESEEIKAESISTKNGTKEFYDGLYLSHEFDGTVEMTLKYRRNAVDRSEKADAERFRWLLNGNGYFMEENGLCGHDYNIRSKDQDHARRAIDKAMREDPTAKGGE